MLPTDYPDDFAHTGLNAVWFEGIPWTCQSAIIGVNSRLRAIRNPVTQAWVVVLKLNPEDHPQTFPFFATAVLVGWTAIAELKPGTPVEALYRLAEGFARNAKWYDEHYGPSVASMLARRAADRKAAEQSILDNSHTSTAQAVAFMKETIEGAGSSLKQGMSPRRRAAMWAGAGAEWRRERELQRAREGKAPFVLVSK